MPGIRYVVDPGTARISRYSQRTKVQRLPIEPISQASANQRTGRCGRVADGICIRLYSEEDFDARPEFTEPEILRTNLASVILQMTALGLGDIAAFPFVDAAGPPQITRRRAPARGAQALDAPAARRARRGRRRERDAGSRHTGALARCRVDPRLAGWCWRPTATAASARCWSSRRRCPSRTRASGRRQAGAGRPAARPVRATRLGLPRLLNLWRYLQEQQKELSGSAVPPDVQGEFLNYLRIREWQDLYSQLRQVAKQLGIDLDAGDRAGRRPHAERRCHQSLLAGLLSHIGLRDDGEARVPRRARRPVRASSPARPCSRSQPQLGDGGRAGRDVPAVGARQRPDRAGVGRARWRSTWSSAATASRTGRSRARPWRSSRSRSTAYRSSSPRKVNYGRIDPEVSRELFIRHALVEGDWRHPPPVLPRQPRAPARARGARAPGPAPRHPRRRRDAVRLLRRAGARPTSSPARHFDSWWKKARREQPDLLTFTEDLLMQRRAPSSVADEDYPRSWRQGELELPSTYQFEPGAEADGVTVHVPLAGAQPGDGRGLRLAGARPARGARHRAAPVAAQGHSPATSCPPRTTPPPPWPTPARRRPPAHRRAGAGPAARAPASACRATRGTCRGCRTTCSHLPGRRDDGAVARRGQGPRGPEGPPGADSCRRRCRGARARCDQPVAPPGTSHVAAHPVADRRRAHPHRLLPQSSIFFFFFFPPLPPSTGTRSTLSPRSTRAG